MIAIVTVQKGARRRRIKHRDVLRIEQYPTMLCVTYADIGRESGANSQFYPRDSLVRIKLKGIV